MAVSLDPRLMEILACPSDDHAPLRSGTPTDPNGKPLCGAPASGQRASTCDTQDTSSATVTLGPNALGPSLADTGAPRGALGLLALGLLLATEIEFAVTRDGQGSLVPLALLLAALVLPVAWRRRAPLLATSAVMAATVVLAFTAVYRMNLVMPNYAVFVLPYAVAAYEPRRRAIAGLAICWVAMIAGNLVSGSGAASWIFAIIVCTASWSAGRAMRTRRPSRLHRQAQSSAAASPPSSPSASTITSRTS